MSSPGGRKPNRGGGGRHTNSSTSSGSIGSSTSNSSSNPNSNAGRRGGSRNQRGRSGRQSQRGRGNGGRDNGGRENNSVGNITNSTNSSYGLERDEVIHNHGSILFRNLLEGFLSHLRFCLLYQGCTYCFYALFEG